MFFRHRTIGSLTSLGLLVAALATVVGMMVAPTGVEAGQQSARSALSDMPGSQRGGGHRPLPDPNELVDSPSGPWPGATCPDRSAWERPIAAADEVFVPILAYHHVGVLSREASALRRSLTVSPQAFAEQMAYLNEHSYHAISLAELADYFELGIPLPAKPVILTFDDGWREQYEVVYPILRQHCMVGTFFPPTNWIDHSTLTMTWAQIEEMSRGGMEIGSHTVNHHFLTNQTDASVLEQLRTSKAILEQHTRQPVVALAYPGGAVDERVMRLVPQAGYRAAVDVRFGYRHRATTLFRLNRISVTYSDDLKAFARKLRTPAVRVPPRRSTLWLAPRQPGESPGHAPARAA